MQFFLVLKYAKMKLYVLVNTKKKIEGIILFKAYVIVLCIYEVYDLN